MSSMADVIEVRTLGDFSVRWAGTLVLSPAAADRRSTALFKALLRRPGYRCSAETLADEFWPDSSGKAARTNLRVRLHELRGAFHIGAERGGLRDPVRLERGMLFIDPEYGPRVDAVEFERDALALLDLSLSPPAFARRAAPLLERYGGDYLPGDDDEQTVSIRERLARLHRSVLARLAAALIASGNARDALDLLRDAFVRYPYDEAIAEMLVVRLTLLGRREQAHETYAAHARELFRTTALRPSERLSELLVGDADAIEGFAPPRAGSFVGRVRERESLEALVRDAAGGAGCAVTVVGSQGVGKTRLLSEVLHAARGRGIATGSVRCFRAPSAGMAADPLASAVERLLRSILAQDPKRGGAETAGRGTLEAAAGEFFEGSARVQNPAELHALVTQTLEAIVRGRPSILAVDDADLDERAFSPRAVALVAATRSLPLLWIFVRRSAPVAGLRAEAPWHELELAALPSVDCTRILEQYFEGPVDPQLVSMLGRLWPGDLAVMLTAAERVRTLSAADGGVWSVPTALPVDSLVPETLAAVIERRMDALTQLDLDVVRAAAFLDADVSPLLVAKLLEIEEAQAQDALGRLALASLVLREGGALCVPGAVAVIARAGLTEGREATFGKRLRRKRESFHD